MNVGFTDLMRILRYPRLISMESFTQPNFELVAEILCWMVHRFDPGITIHSAIHTEQDRVQFLTGIVKAIYSKAEIELDAYCIYSADGLAVMELLKLAKLLHKAVKMAQTDEKELETIPFSMKDIQICRSLVNGVTEQGAKLNELLLHEEKCRLTRNATIQFLDVAADDIMDSDERKTVDRALHRLVEEEKKTMKKLDDDCRSFKSDKVQLEQKLKKKTLDLERDEKRLKNLTDTRPAFMDELEGLEVELEAQYELYMERFRNVHYLKHEVEKFEKIEQEQLEESERAMKRFQEKFREKDMRILRGEDEMGADVNQELGESSLKSSQRHEEGDDSIDLSMEGDANNAFNDEYIRTHRTTDDSNASSMNSSRFTISGDELSGINESSDLMLNESIGSLDNF